MAFDITYHDDETMHKVYRALSSVGLDDKNIINAVTRMQNDGILFREIVADEAFKLAGGASASEKSLDETIKEHQIQREIDRGY